VIDTQLDLVGEEVWANFSGKQFARATVDDLVRDHGPEWANAKVFKGGACLKPNPANKRAAVRRYEVPYRALEDNGFRCAKSVAAWPNADVWLSQIRQ
jgi:formylglycine-generating enzyme required for sulfatase activity